MSLSDGIYRAFHLGTDVTGPFNVKLGSQVFPMTPDERDAIEDYEREFLVKFTYNSNAIEGSTLSLGDTELIFDGEFPTDVEDKRLSDVFAAMGIKEGCELARRLLADGVPVTEGLVKDIHQATALDCQPRTRGVYRVTPAYIRNSRTVPASAEQVRPLMADLMFAYGASPMPPLARAAAFHAMFEAIHPFRDGNGRTGRIILNYMLETAGYPPIAIKAAGKPRYLNALESWQVDGDPAPLLELVCECAVEEIEIREDVLAQTRRAVALQEGDVTREAN